ncbi:hypothetical protein ABZ341_17055 [Streptomyces sp. NPDC006173]|uniref:hypothetical protein n=1 Tax=Streptomyces sp. NPDC006173 TaxID=3155349 RepID=UPI0033CF026A
MHLPQIADGIILRGGPVDGRTLPLTGDPLNPPDVVVHQDAEGQHIYTPRPLADEDDGPLWMYVFLRTEPLHGGSAAK